jgi:uncharacterized protein YjbI with pentapeptide repeats
MDEKRLFDKRLVAVIRIVGHQLFDRLYRDGQLCTEQFAEDRSICGISDAEHADAEHADAEHADTEHADAEHADTEHADAKHADAKHADA